MNYTKTENRLMEAMAKMDIIDCHEHLPPEDVRTSSPQDVFTLFSHYAKGDLFSAGMDRQSQDFAPWSEDRPQHQSLFDHDIPLQKRWEKFQPYWRHIRYGSYAQAAILTAKLVYGIDHIGDDTYEILSERIAAENTPGIYRRILSDTCRIKAAITQCDRTDVEPPLVPVMWIPDIIEFRTREGLEKFADSLDISVNNLDDYVALLRKQLEKWLYEGTIGIKIWCKYNTAPDGRAAESALKKLLDGQTLAPDSRDYEPLENYLLHKVIDMATDLDMVVAVHAGMWGDFRNLDSKNMLTLSPAHPRTNFDLYHLGMPYVRDTIIVAKNLPNVYLNLCWIHIISQVQACSGIDELLDQVPVNKILAFGGDYCRPVEKVVGHLHMARENFARVFGARIDRQMMSFDEAVEILKLWFWDNPLTLYSKLQV